MKKIILFFILCCCVLSIRSQVLMNRDSLLKLLPAARQDSNAVLLYINIGQQYETTKPELAKYYYSKAGELSHAINYTGGVFKYISNYSYVLNMQGLFDSSLLLNQKAVDLARKMNDSLNLGKALFNAGSSCQQMSDYENAVQYYEEGKRIFLRFGDEETEMKSNDILQLLFYNMRKYEKGIECGIIAVKGFRSTNNLPWLSSALNNLGLNYMSVRKIDTAALLFKEALQIGNSTGDKYIIAAQSLNLGDVLIQKGEFEKIKPYMERALALSKELELYESELIALKGLSYYYQFKGDYNTAEKYAQQCLGLSYQFNLKSLREKIFTQLSNIAYSKQDMVLGEYYATQSTLLGDSLLNETIQKNTLELEKKYETEKKQTQIGKLEAEKKIQQSSLKQKSTLNYVLAGSAFALLLISLLSFRTYKQKQKLQQQRISELETQQQLTATEAVLKGEEQERTRLAKDLHDGLGGMLSGIKYSFQTMKGNLVMTPDNAQAFERSMDMLDSSIKEMRRVAHNMMPEALVKFGLDTALKDFCNDINQSGALQVSYQSIGVDNIELEQTTAITIYRIVQELINNTMKHAAAKTAMVQVSVANGLLSVTVEDDGKGFDKAILKQVGGIGWSNIQNRVEFLKGNIDVRSEKDKGTSVHIEMNI